MRGEQEEQSVISSDCNKTGYVQAYNTHIKAIGTCLKSKAGNLLERSSSTKVGTMMATFDRPDKQEANAHQRKSGKDTPRMYL
jgi:hypothetical protein